jgi:hypothetical protein
MTKLLRTSHAGPGKDRKLLFTLASAVFHRFRQIVTPIIRSKTELPIFGHLFVIGVGTGKSLQKMNPPQVGPVLEKLRHDGIRRSVMPGTSPTGHGDPSGQAALTETRAAKSPVTSDLPTFAAPATTEIFPSAHWSFHNHRTGCAATSAATRTTARNADRDGRSARPDGFAPAPSFPRPPFVVSGTNASIATDDGSADVRTSVPGVSQECPPQPFAASGTMRLIDSFCA